MRSGHTRLLVIGGISGIAIPGGGLSAEVSIDWNHYVIESFILFAQSGAASPFEVSMIDTKTSEPVFSSDDGSTFMAALALVGTNPSIVFPGGPRWFRMRRRVTPDDRWLMQVRGPVGAVPIFAVLVTRVDPTENLAA